MARRLSTSSQRPPVQTDEVETDWLRAESWRAEQFGRRENACYFRSVLPLNLIANTAIFYIAARLYLLPLVSRFRPQQILVPILLLHSTRHLGMMFLTRGATYPGLPPEFAYPAAFGDLATAMIAFVAIPLVLRGSRLAKPMVWTFNIVGTLRSARSDHYRHDL